MPEFGEAARLNGAAVEIEQLLGALPQDVPERVRPKLQVQLQALGYRHQDVGEVACAQVLAPALEEGAHHRLLEAYHLVAGPRRGNVAAPVFQVVVLRQNQVGHRGGVVHESREAEDKGHVVAGVPESGGVRQAVHGVGTLDHQHLHVALLHLGDQLLPVIERCGLGRGREALDGRGRVGDDAAIPAETADEMVQRVDRREIEQPVGVRRRAAAADGKPVAGGREVVSDSAHLHGGHTRPRLYQLWGELIEHRRVAARQLLDGARCGQAVGDDHVRHAQREQALLAGAHEKPLVGVGGRHRKPRLHLYERAALALALPEVAVAPRVAHGGDPRVQEVGAERQHVARVVDVEVGQAVLVEHLLDGPAKVGLLEHLVGHVAATVARHEAIDHVAHVGARRLGYEHHGLLVAGGALVIELIGEAADGVGPAYLLVLARSALAGAYQRPAYAVGVVERLQARLAACAVLAAVDRVVDVALDLLGPALHHAHHEPLAGGAAAAERGVPVGKARHHVFRHLQRALYVLLLLGDATGREDYRACRRASGER